MEVEENSESEIEGKKCEIHRQISLINKKLFILDTEVVEDEDSDDIELPSTSKEVSKKKKIGKKGIIYISSIPKHMNVAICRGLLESYGEINRIFLQPDKKGTKSKI